MAGITRTTSIPQANIFGRVGSGIGQGLAEQLPREIERGRLASGLGQLGKQEGLTPFQQFSALASLPGVTPQMIQSGAELLRQQGISQGFRRMADSAESANSPAGKGQPFQSTEQSRNVPSASNQYNPQQPQENAQGVATPGPTQATLNPPIPKTLPQMQIRAGQLQKQSPDIYPDPASALAGAVQEDQQLQAQYAALQGQRKGQQDVQNTIRKELDDVIQRAGVKIPDNVYQPIEKEAMDAVRNGEVDELTAAKLSREKMDAISREYDGIKRISAWNGSDEMKRSVKSLQQDFDKRNDLENFADTLVGEGGFSYPIAYWNAYKDKTPENIKSELNKIKRPGMDSYRRGVPNPKMTEKPSSDFAKKIGPMIRGTDASPLAIAQELKMRGYDPQTFLNYLVDHKRELDLSARQNRELEKGSSWYPKLTDIFFMYGIENPEAVE